MLIAVYLDYYIEPSDIELALILLFDSIIVDALCKDPERNIAEYAAIIWRANSKGISIEAKMDYIEGYKDSLPEIKGSLKNLMIELAVAKDFIKYTRV